MPWYTAARIPRRPTRAQPLLGPPPSGDSCGRLPIRTRHKGCCHRRFAMIIPSGSNVWRTASGPIARSGNLRNEWQRHMGTIDYAVFVIYIVATLVLGFYAGRLARRKPRDYFL